MKKYLVISTALIMIMTMFIGCAKAASPAETDALNLLWWSTIGTDSMFECPYTDIQSLYPFVVFDALVRIDPDGKTVVPSLAKSVEYSSDRKTIAFTLVENAKWHDGTPFTAEDVVFSYNAAIREPASILASPMLSVSGVSDVLEGKAETVSGITADGNKVIFSLDMTDNSLTTAVFAGLKILPKHLLKDVDLTLLSKYEAYWKKPVGTGPYKIDEVSFPNYFTAVLNEDYFGAKPSIPKLAFRSYDTGGVESIAADLIAGRLDYASGNAVNDINSAKNIVAQNPDIKMLIVPGTYQRQFWLNNVGSTDNRYNDDLQKKEVRQAFNLLIDKEAVASFYEGQAIALTTFVNQEFPSYNKSIPLFKRDVNKAREMLIQAGFDFNRPVRLLYYYEDPTSADIMELIKQNFAEAGVKLEPFLATGSVANAQLWEGVQNWDMAYGGSFDADPILIYKELTPDQGVYDGRYGAVQYREEILAKLLNDYKSASSDAEMKAAGDQLQLEALDFCVVIPIYGMNKVVLYNTANLKLDESIFDLDLELCRDYRFETWQLVK